MLTYRSILVDFPVRQKGDFYALYEINGMQYVIYAPNSKEISCIELCKFRDISPAELCLFIEKRSEEFALLEEFSFLHFVLRDDLIAYLFDIDKLNEHSFYESYISSQEGFLLYDKGSKAGNLYAMEDPTSMLLFDNSFCYQVVKKTDERSLHICFCPSVFNRLIKNEEILGTIYLLANTSHFLLSKIDYQGFSVNIFSDTDLYKVLQTYIFLQNSKTQDPSFILFSDNKQVSVFFPEERFELERVVNLIGSAENKIRTLFGSDIRSCYDLRSQSSGSYVFFRHVPVLIKSFISALIETDSKINVIY